MPLTVAFYKFHPFIFMDQILLYRGFLSEPVIRVYGAKLALAAAWVKVMQSSGEILLMLGKITLETLSLAASCQCL